MQDIDIAVYCAFISVIERYRKPEIGIVQIFMDFPVADIIQITEKYNPDTVVRLKQDEVGYYLENSITGLRTASRATTEFNEIEEAIIKGGIL